MASPKSTVTMSTVMRDISDALSLDRNDKKEEAYRKYLECVLRISTKLLKDLHSEGGHVTFNKDVTRFSKLGQQCMERAAAIAAEQGAKGPAQTPDSRKVFTPGMVMSLPATLPSTGVTSTSRARQKPKSEISTKKLTPTEMAVKHNQQLLAAYKARTEKSRSSSASQTLALTVQRKMAENLAIAKAREEALAKKMRERQKRLEEQAAKRFHTPIGLSEEDLHQRQIYTKILEFEQEEIWMLDLRKQLEDSPTDVIVIFNLIEKVLCCESHPLTQQLKVYQEKTLERLCPLVQNKTEQVNLVRVPLPKHLLSILTKFQKDQINFTVKTVTKSKSLEEKVSEIGKDFSESKHKTDQYIIENNDNGKDTIKHLEQENFSEKLDKDESSQSDAEGEKKASEQKPVQDAEMNKGDDEVNEKCTESLKVTEENSKEDNVQNSNQNAAKENVMEITTSEVVEDSRSDSDENEVVSDGSGKVHEENTAKTSIIKGDKNTTANADNVGVGKAGPTKEMSGLESCKVESNEEHKSKKDTKTKSVRIEENIVDMTKSVKEDLETAIRKGEQLKDKLERENSILKSHTRISSIDIEKYNEENMDDLFDCDEDSDENDSAFGSSFYSTVSGIWRTNSQVSEELPNSSKKPLSTQTSVISSDAQSDVGVSLETNESDPDIIEKMENNSETDSIPTCDSSKDENANFSFQNIESRIKQLRNEAYHRHLKHITEDILTSIEKIQVLFVIGFEQLDTAEGRDQCNVLIEKYFFKPIWKYLLMLFRLANEPKEIAISHMMTLKEGKQPEDFSVREKLCLSASNSSERGDYSYKPAVTELCRVVEKPTMLDKLECLVKTSRLVLYCVDQYYEQDGRDASKKPNIGADDLLPVLCYIVARSKLPELVSECQAMESFIHEGYMYGEEGYCLTSFQTAINYLISEGMKLASCETS